MSETGTSPAAKHATVPCIFCLTLNRVDMARVQERPKCGQCGKPMLLDRPIKVGDPDLERLVAGTDVPVLVDFYADWCGPCKIMAPVLDEVAREYHGRVLVAKLDTDRSPTMAVRYAIRGIPTMILFQHGRERTREVGAVPRPRLEALLEEALLDGGPHATFPSEL
jgi:thioredoxin 2